MPFSGNELHDISLNDASIITKAYRDSAGATAILGVFFGKTAISDIIGQKDCVGIRIYNAIKDGKLTFVIVGATADEEDMGGGNIAELGLPCPPYCPTDSVLNGTA
ncbi:MAG: hypothetical protein V3W18_14545 [candidate division Zixibacteria bacterium]